MNYFIYREYRSFKKSKEKKLTFKFWVLMFFLLSYIICLGLFEKFKDWYWFVGALASIILFLVLICREQKKYNGNEIKEFEKRKKDREELLKKLKNFQIDDKDRVVSLQNWLKVRMENFEARVKRTLVIFSTVTFSGLVAFSGSVLPSVFDMTASVPEFILEVIIWGASLIFVSFLVVMGLYSTEYFEYKNMKLFFEDLQDILDYNLYEEKQEENKPNENEEDKPQEENNELIKDDENLETENKPKTKKCKMKMGRKITIEIVKYDYTGDSSAES